MRRPPVAGSSPARRCSVLRARHRGRAARGPAVRRSGRARRARRAAAAPHVRADREPRGEILDRSGTPLAITVEARDVYATPRFVVDAAGDRRDDRRRSSTCAAPRLRRRSSTTGRSSTSPGRSTWRSPTELADLALPGIGFLDSPRRYYPAGTLAAQVLGFVERDGVGLDRPRGRSYEDCLAGTPGERTVELSAARPGRSRAGPTPTTSRSPATTWSRRSTARSSSRCSGTCARRSRDNGAQGGHRRS